MMSLSLDVLRSSGEGSRCHVQDLKRGLLSAPFRIGLHVRKFRMDIFVKASDHVHTII